MDLAYNFQHESRGIALLIHNEQFEKWSGYKDRPGDTGDYERMKEIFSKLGFTVHPYRNLTSQEIWSVIETVSAMDETHKKSDCFVCVIASHGEEIELERKGNVKIREHVIIGTEGKGIKTRDVVETFDEDNCEGLKGKPKFFFIQACRTGNHSKLGMDQGHFVSLTDKKEDSKPCAGNIGDQLWSVDGQQQNSLGSQSNPMHMSSAEQQVDARSIETEEESDTRHMSSAEMFLNSRRLVHQVTDVPCPEDTLLMFASLSSNFAVRNSTNGGWLLTSLYSQLKEYLESGQLSTTEFTKILNSALKEMTTKNFKPSDTTSPLYGAFSPGCFTHCLTRNIFFTKKL